MTKIALLCAAAAVATLAAPASALTFSFTYTGTGINAVGTLATTDTTTLVNGRQAYTITGITGTRNGAAINQFYAAGLNIDGVGAFTDNYLYATGEPSLTSGGFAFGVAGDTPNMIYNPYFFGRDYSEYSTNATRTPPYGANPFLATFTLRQVAAGAVPEPASWAMMILGMGVVGGAMRRRGKISTRVSYAV